VIDFVGLTSSRLDFLSELAKNRGPRLIYNRGTALGRGAKT
jgi:hypothetical protein